MAQLTFTGSDFIKPVLLDKVQVDITALYAAIAAVAAGSGVKVSDDDDIIGTLEDKLTAGGNISLTVNEDGGVYTLEIAVPTSPEFTGIPLSTTATTGTNTTQIATTAFTNASVSAHEAKTATHGVTGALVGTTDSQTLANKTLTSPVMSTAVVGGETVTLPTATDTLVGKATTDTLTNKTLTSPVLNTGVSGTAVLDEDNLASDSDTHLATQQSIKAYVDTKQDTITGAATTVVSDDLTGARVVVTTAGGKLSASTTITTTELSYLNGLTGALTTLLAAKLNIADDRVVSAWCNFDGPATAVLGQSHNVSAVQTVDTGRYRVTWDTDFDDIDYCVVITQGTGSGNGAYVVEIETQAAGYCDFRIFNTSWNYVNASIINVIAMGSLV